MTLQSLTTRFHKLPNNVKGGIILMFAAAGFGFMVALINRDGINCSPCHFHRLSGHT